MIVVYQAFNMVWRVDVLWLLSFLVYAGLRGEKSDPKNRCMISYRIHERVVIIPSVKFRGPLASR